MTVGLASPAVRWALVPALALAAYVTSLRVGFLADDLGLYRAGARGASLLLPDPGWFFYRPAGFFLTWVAGRVFWGTNPLPYHIISLALHMGTALVLGLWLAEVTRRRAPGIVAGCVFAVFPLSHEAVSWLSAQWDEWATMFAISSLWVFTAWWRRVEGKRPGSRRLLYGVSLALFFLGVFSKESVLTFVPVFALSAWLLSERLSRLDWREWGKLALVLTPFAGVIVLNLGLRLLTWGRIGSYPDLRTDFGNFFWDGLTGNIRELVSPVNTAILGDAALQITGAICSLALLLGLIWFGRPVRRLLLTACAWVLLALIPVINLAPVATDLRDTRFLYLASAGYCALVGVLAYSAFAAAPARWRVPVLGIGALVLALCVLATWLYLRPWHTATIMNKEIEDELLQLVPPPAQPRPYGMVWYVGQDNLPDHYKGAALLIGGLGRQRFTSSGDDLPAITRVPDVNQALVSVAEQSAKADSFAMTFAYDPGATLYVVSHISGFSWASPPPSDSLAGSDLVTWDFRGCGKSALGAWQVANATAMCSPGKGLTVSPTNDDPQMLGPGLSVGPSTAGARFVRLRAQVAYGTEMPGDATNEWFWSGHGLGWQGLVDRRMPVVHDGQARVYWTYIPAAEIGAGIDSLRFDPVNGKVPATIQWLAVDLVK